MVRHGFLHLTESLEAECRVVEHGGVLTKLLEGGSRGGQTLVGPPHAAQTHKPLLNQNPILRESGPCGLVGRLSFWDLTGFQQCNGIHAQGVRIFRIQFNGSSQMGHGFFGSSTPSGKHPKAAVGHGQ